MVCLDTDFLVGVLRGEDSAMGRLRDFEAEGAPLRASVITAYELMKGASISGHPDQNLASVEAILGRLDVLPLTRDEVTFASSLYSTMKRAGATVGELDILIAATVQSHGETLVTRDRDFDSVRPLRISRW